MPEQRFVISHNEAPPSLNAGGAGARRHWGAAHREKMRWEGIYCALLLEQKVPTGMERCRVNAWLTFKTAHRRDPENYRPAVSKPLADCLVKGRWLPDDTAEFFVLQDFDLATGLKIPGIKAKLVVEIFATYPAA